MHGCVFSTGFILICNSNTYTGHIGHGYAQVTIIITQYIAIILFINRQLHPRGNIQVHSTMIFTASHSYTYSWMLTRELQRSTPTIYNIAEEG